MEDTYRDCMKNHSATLGTYATDGCGEYTSDTSSSLNLFCSACGCHRNFHRKVPSDHRQHYHQQQQKTHFLGYSVVGDDAMEERKRRRTKFSSEQKEKMRSFAEKIRWRIPRREGDGADELGKFCRETGITRQIFKVWMHNHKNTSTSPATSSSAADANCTTSHNPDAAMAAAAAAATSSNASGSTPSMEE